MLSVQRVVLALLLLVTLAGCVTAPTVNLPQLNTPGGFKGKPSAIAQPREASVAALSPGTWLRGLGDAKLKDLLNRAVTGNVDLKVLAARMDAARAAVTIAGADRWPQLRGAGALERRKFPTRTGGQLAEQQAALGDTIVKNPSTFWQFGPQVSYEIDLWGRIARAREAAQADLRAESEDYDAAVISVTLEIAQSYFAMRVADRRALLLDARRNDLNKLLSIARERLAVGAADANEARREAAELSQITADIAETQRGRTILENRIATLVGESSSNYQLPAEPGWTLPQRRDVPAGLPAALLERRPDLRAANERFVAAQARIGEAKAAALPTLELTGSYGFTSDKLRTLVRTGGAGWGIGPSISIPIFTGFRNQARVDSAVAQAREAALSWERTALTAFEEAENALTSIAALQTRTQRAEETLEQLRSIELSLQRQVEIGRRAGLEVLRIRSEVLAAEDRLITSRQAELYAQLLLIRALGGDWRA